MRQIKSASTVASPRAGLIRVALAGAVALLLALAFPGAGVAYLAPGLALLLGMSLILGRPAVFARERLVRVFLDSAIVGVLVVFTGGAGSPFFPLYFIAALGIAWIETRPKVRRLRPRWWPGIRPRSPSRRVSVRSVLPL